MALTTAPVELVSLDGSVTINDSSADVDFRIESNGNQHMLFVDAGNDHVNIGTSSDFGGVLNVNGGAVFDDATTFDPDTMGSGRIAIGSIADGGGFSADGIGWGGSSGNTGAIVHSAGTLFFGVGDGSSADSLDSIITVSQANVLINDSSKNCDFKIESDGNANMLIVDAGDDAVYIGKNSSTQNTAGTAISTSIGVRATVDQNVASILNRTTNDGSIISFRKDGTESGNIATEGGDMAIGNDDAGIQFVNGTEHFRPFSMASNASTDNLMDIGSSSKRFKDFYIAGVARVGSVETQNGDVSIKSLDTSVNDGESLGALNFVSSDSSTGGAGTQAKIEAIGSSSGTAYSLSFSTGSSASPTEKMNISPSGEVTMSSQPSFHVRRNGDQTGYNAETSGQAVVLYNYEEHDRNSNFDTSTGKFTAPVDGVYYFQGAAYMASVDSSQSWFVVNNARENGTDTVYATAQRFPYGTAIIKLDANDTVGFKPYASSVTNTTITANVYHTWFRGYLIG